MPLNRYRLPDPEGPAATKLEIIMSPFSLPGCRQADDLAVTVRGSFFIALVVGPLIAIAGTTGGWQVTALVISVAAVARGTQAVYRRVRAI
ncbi:hypothetical protein [Streptomyces cupreus]|uniref:Uncharacterized protein n=1 Tax=Streptomyces cupreus TaxID=2759956 RepID=A0A7X1MBD3_9ACTN|nr:hypothetical protein [Streptomyces cupreus]MBC2905274.1 hypothetical protein [Streptomyces cupreus]